jgi:hypothetical protein
MVFSSLFQTSQSNSKKKGKTNKNPPASPAGSHRGRKRRFDPKNADDSKETRKHVETQTRQTKNPKKGPCPEALRLSERLKTLSRNKDLSGALEVYRDKSNDSIRDEFHACIVLDCCGRCGSMSVSHRLPQVASYIEFI